MENNQSFAALEREQTPEEKIKNTINFYCELREERKRIEKEMDSMKPAIKEFLKTQEGRQVVYEDIAVEASLESVTRESFQLAKAKEVMDMRTLNPFVKTTTYDELNVDRIKKD